MKNCGKALSSILFFLSYVSYGQKTTYDLAIKHANLFDSKTKTILKNVTILIHSDSIVTITRSSVKLSVRKTIDAHNRLVVPGFIDSHTHLRNIYGTLENVEKKEGVKDRQKLSDIYLKYGSTTIIDMGQPEKWMDQSLNWQKNPLSEYPNIYISGGAIVTLDSSRNTYMNHVAVKSPEEGKLKVRDYASKGLQHIKIYWRLKEPEMEAVISEAKEKHLTLSAHIDNNLTSISKAIDSGVKNFEHMLSLPPAVLTLDSLYPLMKEKYGLASVDNNDKFLSQILFFFDFIKHNPESDQKLKTLFNKMAKNDVTLSTAIHIMGSVAGKTYFFTSLTLNADTLNLSGYTSAQKEKLAESFDTMMYYLKYAHDTGVKIRIGTDCKDGGKALLSEMLLLYEANFKMKDILQIATLNGAEAMDIDDKYGSIETGKKADLIIFNKSPLKDYRNILSDKIIIKGGKIYQDK